jgi:hypothetical protein
MRGSRRTSPHGSLIRSIRKEYSRFLPQCLHPRLREEFRFRAGTLGEFERNSYERLVNVTIPLNELWVPAGLTGASPISDPLKNPEAVGLSLSFLIEKAIKDEGIAEFCRFYIDRRKQELTATGADARKQKKIEDDFTPRPALFVKTSRAPSHWCEVGRKSR